MIQKVNLEGVGEVLGPVGYGIPILFDLRSFQGAKIFIESHTEVISNWMR
jgi:hypothetical protein